MPCKNKFYVTTPIYYVNAKPHIGTLYSTLIADVIARWNKIKGKKVFFLTGTDEHGQKIEEKAKLENMAPQDFVDSMIPSFKSMWQRFDLDYDHFIRTTDRKHVEAVNTLLIKLIEKGDIYKSEYIGLYCVPCETFVTAESAHRDAASNLMCPTCVRALREVSEESYFFRLSAYEEQLLKFYDENPNFISPKERINEVVSFVKSGLKDLSISRKTVKWGIPFPGDPEHTVYVWGDALTNYISAVGYGDGAASDKISFDYWWPADVQVMAKDIVRFHAVYWPAFLMAADLPLPKQLLVHGYIMFEDSKMSKSKGNVVDPALLAEHYGVDQTRYYLMRHMAVNQDGSFSYDQMEKQVEADLANNLGNLLSRIVSLAIANGLTHVSPVEQLEGKTALLKDKCEEAFRAYWDEMNHHHYHVAIANLWTFISEVNAYVHAQQPWKLAKENPELFAEVVSAVCHSLYAIGVLAWPIMPKKMEELLSCLGVAFDYRGHHYMDELRANKWNMTFNLKKNETPLFPRPEPMPMAPGQQELEKQSEDKLVEEYISIEDFAKVELIVGTIIECEPMPKSDKLLRMQVDFGNKIGIRQVLSGIAQHFGPKDLIGKQGVYVGNLAPRKMMGTTSQGMMLFAEDESGVLAMAMVAGKVANGTRLR